MAEKLRLVMARVALPSATSPGIDTVGTPTVSMLTILVRPAPVESMKPDSVRLFACRLPPLKLVLGKLVLALWTVIFPAVMGTVRLTSPPTVVKRALSGLLLSQVLPVQLVSVVFQFPVAAPLFQTRFLGALVRTSRLPVPAIFAAVVEALYTPGGL